MTLLKPTMNDTNVLLPNKRGSIIGWSVYDDSEYFFCCAVLDYGYDREELVWHVAGTSKYFSFEEIQVFAKNWQILGCVETGNVLPLKRYGKYEKELIQQITELEDQINTEKSLISWKENQTPRASVSSNKRKLNRMVKKLNMLRKDLDELLNTGV